MPKKKKRKYVRKDKSPKLFSDVKREPVTNVDYTTEVEEDDFLEEQRAAFDSIQNDIHENYRESEDTETKPIEKKTCSTCVEIDNALKRGYILTGAIILILMTISWASKKGNVNPKIIGFFYGIFAMLLLWNITLIFSFKKLREKFIEQ